RHCTDRMIHAFESNEVGDHHGLIPGPLHRFVGQNCSCRQFSRQQPDVFSRQAHGSDGFSLLPGLDSDDVEAVEIPHRVEPVWKNLPMGAVPRMAQVTAVEEQEETEMAIRDFVDELADLLVIDDDHGGRLRPNGRAAGTVEMYWLAAPSPRI